MRIYAPLPFAGLFLPLLCFGHPEAEAEADPQTYTNNAPFSGAIYIVDPNGHQISTTNTNMCPNVAAVSCNSISAPSWCCPNSYTCAVPANSGGMVGCCPAGSSCAGSVNVASITTITVQAQQQTVCVYPQPTTVAIYNVPAVGGFCQTLTMNGPGLPTTRQGSCGTILIVNAAGPSLKAVGYWTGMVVVLFHLALGRMFYGI